jgi:alcohol dehydrogenase class IV
MTYNFPPAVHFGWGEAEKVAGHVKDLKVSKVLIVTDEGCRRVGLLERVIASRALRRTWLPYYGRPSDAVAPIFPFCINEN